MNTKLTLTIERSVIEKAKKYAKDKERSLSNLIENYLKALTKESESNEIELTPIVKSLKVLLPLQKTLIIKGII